MDTFSPRERSEIMRRVRSTNTAPEKQVRSLLHRLGFRFRLHGKGLPGKPDIVLPKHAAVVFVHGCFWHRHAGCKRASTPAANQAYWLPKFERTVARDRKNQRELIQQGWNVIVVWECELRNLDQLADRLKNEIAAFKRSYCKASSSLPMAAEKQAVYQVSGIQDGEEKF